MPKFAANLTMMFNEWSFLDRFSAAADAGFDAVEFLFPYDHTPGEIASALQSNGLTLALFNLPPGDWEAGERGMAALPERGAEVAAGAERALEYIAATGASHVHLMAGLADRADPAAQESYRRAVTDVAERLAPAGVTLVLEPINGRDMPGYFLNDFPYAETLIAGLGLPNLQLQFDIYHHQIMHGDVTMALRRLMPMIGHIQIASVPSRNEPDGEELNYPSLFAELDALGYSGFIGCEYRPRGATLDGLGWLGAWLGRAK